MNYLKKLIKLIFSMQFMGILVAILGVSMAVATFIESRSGTTAAQAVVYQAWWFELAILLVFINILANIIRFKLYNLKKLPIFIFHLAFLVIIIGAALTRFVGKEGSMSIREGETTADYMSSDTYFYIKATNSRGTVEEFQKVYLSPMSKKQVNLSFRLGDDRIRIKSREYVSGSQMKMGGAMANMGQGNHPDVLQVKVTINEGSEEVMIRGQQRSEFIGNEFELSGIQFNASFGAKPMSLPFSLKLDDFQMERYPGSNSPSSYASEVVLVDPSKNLNKPYRIFMNNILTHRGYRFYQSSFDQDEKGTVLSVNQDGLGTTVTYIGYAMMILFIILALFAPKSRFRRLLKESRKTAAVAGVILLVLFSGVGRLNAQSLPEPPGAAESREFGKIWVQGSEGRMKPVNTLAQEMIRKMFGKNHIQGMSPEQFWLSLILQPDEWQQARLFEVKNRELASAFNIQGRKASFNDFVTKDEYLLAELVNVAYNKKPNQRNGYDKAILKLDEALNVFYMGMNGTMLRIYPDPRDAKAKWIEMTEIPAGLAQNDSLLIAGAIPQYLTAVVNGSAADAIQWREAIALFQKKYGSVVIPEESKAHLEVMYNRALIFERLAIFYALIGLIYLIVQMIGLFKPAKWIRPVSSVFTVLVFAGFLLHTLGLAVRWYVSGHAPMSNGYESMIFVAWGTLLAGLLMVRRSQLTLALTAVLAAMALLVAHMSWMSPEITPLVPVLKSVWLTIHVAVIMTSYSFLGIGALIGLMSMILYVMKTRKNHQAIDGHIRHLTSLNQIVLIAGLYLITIGCFLGAIWANQSWGRYWGWDPKETWCLISILVYTFITHMHNIKGFEGDFSFNLGSLMGFSSILMTYFGVNYFLGGMHAYAGGEAPQMPVLAYVILILLVGLVYLAYFNDLRFQHKIKAEGKRPKAEISDK